MRLLWFSSLSGSVEWFTADSSGKAVALVNGTQAGALKAFRTRSGSIPPVCPDETAEPEISIGRDGEDLVVAYTGTLLQADKVDGLYSEVPGATSPYSVVPTDTAKFFIAE